VPAAHPVFYGDAGASRVAPITSTNARLTFQRAVR
jgi:hypothetical protein